eukprot:10882113-Karenia_brevis.AAC.1
MVAPDQLLQADIRTRQAKQSPDQRFGGLLCVLSGDFLQLPPVRKLTLATKLDDAGFIQHKPALLEPGAFISNTTAEAGDSDAEQALSEARQ